MALKWSQRRKLLYTTVAAILGVGVLWWGYNAFFNAPPTCFDGVLDGTEHGTDCGGTCALLCLNESHAPIVLWTRVFPTGSGNYTAAAYIQNNNPGAGAKNVPYAFQLFDADNQLIVERQGTADLPPVQTIPIIETNIPLNNRMPTRALFSFGLNPKWSKVEASSVAKLSVSNQSLSADGSRLSATLTNSSLFDARVTVGAVLFDAGGIARAASKSTLTVGKKSSAPVVFTFPGGVAGIVRAEITVLPAF